MIREIERRKVDVVILVLVEVGRDMRVDVAIVIQVVRTIVIVVGVSCV
jgi:hypothetical protein